MRQIKGTSMDHLSAESGNMSKFKIEKTVLNGKKIKSKRNITVAQMYARIMWIRQNSRKFQKPNLNYKKLYFEYIARNHYY